jgi:hypothetical protein
MSLSEDYIQKLLKFLGELKMEVFDRQGKMISRGSHVRYTGTGTAGQVLEIKADDEGNWAKLDSTELWYNSSYLQVVDKTEYEKLKSIEEEQLKEKERIKEKIAKLRKSKIGEDVEMSTELCDGGG